MSSGARRRWLDSPYLLPAILAGACVLRIWLYVGLGFNDDIIYASDAFTYANGQYIHPTWWYATRIGVFLPVSWCYRLFGVAEWSSSLYFLICSIATIAATYLIGTGLFDRRAGILAAVLLSVVPADLAWSTQIGPDIPQQCFSALAVLFLLQSKRTISTAGAGILAAVSGACVGLVHTVRETAPLTLVIVLVLGIAVRPTTSPPARRLRAVLGFVAGLTVVFVAFQLFFYVHDHEWFLPERMRLVTVLGDRNNNYSFMYYLKGLFNQEDGRYLWPDNVSYFGWLYYALCPAIVLALVRTNTRLLFVLFWLVATFLALEFGPNLSNAVTMALGRGPALQPRMYRYLIQMSVPACLLCAWALVWLWRRHRWLSPLATVAAAFLVLSSLIYSYQGARFIRRGMLNVKQAAAVLDTLPPRPVFVMSDWDSQKLRYFMRFENRTVFVRYECPALNCGDPRNASGQFIRDAYVVLNLDPYAQSVPSLLPAFAQHVPAAIPGNWILQKVIHVPNRGIFSYDPMIYYAPAGPAAGAAPPVATRSGPVAEDRGSR